MAEKHTRVVSGIRSTGNLHLGNYIGALRQAAKMQHDYECYYFIADYHSLTTHPSKDDFHKGVRQVMVECLASGIDPDKATLYVQSDVPEIPEFYLLLNMLAHTGELERCTSFKEKVREQPDNVNAGLLTYPVLMAADILIHHGEKVPVGRDQEQHLEMARDFARRFNHMYNVNLLPEPQAFNYEEVLVKVPGLDGSGKMSKSYGEHNAIFLTDDDKTIRKKIMRAVTDSGPTEPNQEKSEAVQNLFDLMSHVSSEDTIQYFDEQYNSCQIRYGDFKKQIAADMQSFIAPLRERIQEIEADEEYLKKVARRGAEKARESAAETVKNVRNAIGIQPLY